MKILFNLLLLIGLGALVYGLLNYSKQAQAIENNSAASEFKPEPPEPEFEPKVKPKPKPKKKRSRELPEEIQALKLKAESMVRSETRDYNALVSANTSEFKEEFRGWGEGLTKERYQRMSLRYQGYLRSLNSRNQHLPAPDSFLSVLDQRGSDIMMSYYNKQRNYDDRFIGKVNKIYYFYEKRLAKAVEDFSKKGLTAEAKRVTEELKDIGGNAADMLDSFDIEYYFTF